MNQYVAGSRSGKMCGKCSVAFANPVGILASSSIVGTKESHGPFGTFFDMVSKDDNDMFGGKSWEEAESNMQQKVIEKTLEKSGLKGDQIRYLFAGDLLGQSIATSFGVSQFQIPLFGLYGACSTCGEGLLLGAEQVCAGYADYVISLTSSHFASAEKEFRFPLAYGGQRPLSASWTVTGSGAFLLGNCEKGIAITAVTPGRIMDYGLRDSFNMGCAMAPAAADTIATHLQDMNRKVEDYDAIITGDLGAVGSKALASLLEEKGINLADRHMDCGLEIFGKEEEKQLAGMDTHAGGSGCGCSAVMLSSVLLPKLESKEWKRILFLPTGALLNKTSFQEGNSVPGIAHAVVIENIG